MFWTVILWVAGVEIGLLALIWFIRHHTYQTSKLAEADSVRAETLFPIPRSADVSDRETITRLAAFLTDDKRDPTPMLFPIVCLHFTLAGGKILRVEASQLGWNWPWEKRNSRKLTDSLKFLQLVESLLPEVTESDMDSIEIPEDDLSGFDETKIPEDLRHLVPLAKKWGVGDDLIRSEIIRRATVAERKELMAKVTPLEDRISQFLESLGMPSIENPMSDEAARFMFMLNACNEVLPEQLEEDGKPSNNAEKQT